MTIDTRYALGLVWKRYGRPDLGSAGPPVPPTNLGSSAITDTSVTLTWTLSVSTGITAQRIYLNSTLHTTVANGTSTSAVISNLTPDTGYTWKMTAFNGTTSQNSVFSSAYSMTTTSTPTSNVPNPPQNVTAVKNPTTPTTQISSTWVAPVIDGTHPVQTGYRVYANGVQQGADRAAGVTSTTLTGLTPGQTYSITVKAFNANGESLSSTPAVNVTLDSITSTMMLGCSTSPNSHGGTEVWDGWRTYQQNTRDSYANRTGTQRPKFIAYSQDSGNIGGTNPNYMTVYNEVLADLNAFYYNSTASTQSARWGIKLFWSNGNENSVKGAITLPHTQAKIDAYIVSMRGLYDACHYAPGGVRRFPDAYAGSNPTHDHEFNGDVEGWLHQSAQWHDFVMWSMYPPGRGGSSAAIAADPEYNFPSFVEADRSNRQNGFLIRCYYRTFQAQAAARNATGNPNFSLLIGTGEVGIGDSPENQNTRPYYAVHALAGGMYILAAQYGLQQPFTCWWDQQSGFPENILDDEPVGTNPSTRVAWQNWLTYDHRRGGTHPGTWAGLPGSITNFTGTKV